MQLAPEGQTQTRVLERAKKLTIKQDSIALLASNFAYVFDSANLLDLSDDLSDQAEIQVVAVVDSNSKKIIGIVQRKDIFDLLGRPFGKDVIKQESTKKIAQAVQSFMHDESIFSVLGSMKFTKDPEPRYFAIESAQGEFLGIFSSHDLLVHISELSQAGLLFVKTIQERIFKQFSSLLSIKSELIYASSIPNIGEDFSYAKEYQSGRITMALCKVPGQGLARSLSSTTLWGFVHSFDFRRGIQNFVSRLRTFFSECFGEQDQAQGFFADLNSQNGELLVSDQGYGFGFVLRDKKLLKLKSLEKTELTSSDTNNNLQIYLFNLIENDILIIVGPEHLNSQDPSTKSTSLEKLKEMIIQNDSTKLVDLAKELFANRRLADTKSSISKNKTFILLRYQSPDKT